MLIIFLVSNHIVVGQNKETDSTGNNRSETAWLPCGNAFIGESNSLHITSLQLGGAIGYGRFRDRGTAPISFQGPALTAAAGLWNDRGRWMLHLDALTSVGFYENAVAPRFNFSTFDISSTLRFKALRRIANPFCFPDKLWAGVGACNFLDVTVNTNYENASTGISEFFGPELYLYGEYEIDNSWFLFGGCSVMPVAAMLRPGYAYIDNYTASQPVHSALFDGYEWNAKFFAGLSTEIGVRYEMKNENQLHLSYRWDYHSSGGKGHWRFDHAMHGIYLDLIVHLRNRFVNEK